MKRVTISVINDLVTDQRIQRAADTLSSHGFSVLLIGRRLKESLAVNLEVHSTRRFNMLFSQGPLFYFFYNLRLFLFLLFTNKPSLLYAADLDTLPANFLVSRLRKIPLIYDCHEYFTEVPELVGRRAKKKIWERIEAKLVPKLTYAIAVSDSISKAYEKRYGIVFETVRNVSAFQKPDQKHLPTNQYSTTYLIIYQGALNLGRGIELMIDAMEFLDDATLILAGEGDISKKLRQMVNEKGLTEKVVFIGKLQPGDLRLLTWSCDIGLSLEEDMGLNYRYALPNKLFDYLQARIPVIVSDLPEMASVVNRYEIGEVLVKRTPEKLAEMLKQMLTNTEYRQIFAEKLELAAKDLCWENEQKKLMEIVNKALMEQSV